MKLTRREALKGVGVVAAAEALEKTTDGGFAAVSLPGSPERKRPILPPGSLPREAFARTCVGCGLCTKVCPEQVLKPSVKWNSFGQPEMVFLSGFCRLACDYRCGQACPVGAISKFGGVARADVHQGRAVWKKELCVRTTKGESCTACVRKCPVKAIQLVEGIPVVDETLCIGCGACEHVCPSRPLPAMQVEGYEVPRIVRRMDEATLIAEMKSRLAAGGSAVVAHNGVITAVETGRGVRPLLALEAAGSLKGALVVDKVIGRAAAAICVAGGVRKVHALVMSADARELLRQHGVAASADEVVPQILNRARAGGCPLEEAVRNFNEPMEMIRELRKVTEK